MKITFLGLGQMGFALADRLLVAGFDLTVHNRTRKKAEPLLEKGAKWIDSPREGARNCDILATMVSDDTALRTLLTGPEGFLDVLPRNSIHLSLSTISVAFSKELQTLHASRQQGFVSSPVFGRPDAVVAGNLRLLCAGKPEHANRVLPVLNALGSRVFELGEDPSRANLVKISGNFMIGSVLESLSEAMTLMKKADIDPALFLTVVNDSLFRSPLYENYGRIMVEKRYDKAGFTMDLGLKDIDLVMDAGKLLSVPLPFAGVIRDALLDGLAHGRQPLDWSALLLSSFDRAGIDSE